jgi:Protein of unknown function (DUF4230)
MATLSPPPVQDRRRFRLVRWLVALLCSFIIGAAALVLFVRQATEGMWNDVATTLTGRTGRVDTSQPTVVSRIQRLQRLETVTYTMDKIVEGEREGRVMPPILTGDKLLLVAHGQAIAGVDLSQLPNRDVQVNGRGVHLQLPKAQIFTVALDNEKSRVYSRETGLFVPVDPNLESEVRAKAEEDLRQSALTAGILNTAHQNACGTLRTLLLNLGFEQVQCD